MGGFEGRLVMSDFWGDTMEGDRRLAYYNVENYSIIMVVERLRGGSRTRCTQFLKLLALLDAMDAVNLLSSSSKNSDTF